MVTVDGLGRRRPSTVFGTRSRTWALISINRLKHLDSKSLRKGMVGEPGPTLRYVSNTTIGARHAILIDPADQTPEMAAKRCMAAVSAGSSMVLVGGSTGTDMENVHNTVVAIKEALELVTYLPAKIRNSMKNLGAYQLYYSQQERPPCLLQQMESHS